MANRPGVMLYFDIEPGLKILGDPQRGKLLAAIMEYAHYGVVPDFEDPLLSMAWSFVKTSIDRDGERYQSNVHQKRIAGIKSDFRRNYAPKHGIDPDDEEALQAYIRQRLSTDVDECRPSTTATPKPNPISISKASPSSTLTAKATAAGKGVEGENPNDPPLLDFEQLRQQKLAMLRSNTEVTQK